ncbi:hypothetical protein O181_090912 [Austropuccinia psidii MF-1]|uniref:Uncharacterized protein n=1 Tax=Austropuccinia psidii MF-1 TaxID=1389203 RepID=A0A9Q3P841_9BASI|nr:hypothetical protein [Austropuccinia psidii MF-1]
MTSKLTELTDCSPSAPPPSVLCGPGIFSQFSSPSMASSGHFYPSRTYDGYREVEILDPACTECLAKDAEGSDELDGEEVEIFPHLVGHKSSISSSQPLANRFQSQVIPSTPKTFQPVLASIPTTIPPSSPSTSHARPSLNPEVRPSPNQQPRNSPMTTSQQLQPMASSR